MLVPGQINSADDIFRTCLKTFPACTAFSGIQLHEFCPHIGKKIFLISGYIQKYTMKIFADDNNC